MHIEHLDIYETKRGFWTFRGRRYKTGATALRAAKRYARNAPGIYVVEWHTVTEIGRWVANVLADNAN